MSAHYPIYYQGFCNVDEQGRPVAAHLSSVGCQPLRHICLVHYHMKSWEDWQKRRSLGKADTYGEHEVSREAFDTGDAQLNSVYDDSMLRLQEKTLEAQGHVLIFAKGRNYSLEELEQQLHELLGSYGSLEKEQMLVLYHLCSHAAEKGADCSRQNELQSLLLSLLHLYLSHQQVISIGDYDMLWDEFRRMPAVCPGRGLLLRDLARFEPSISEWKLTQNTDAFDSYIDRLVQSRKPDYMPRVALVTHSLEDRPEVVSLVKVAQILQSGGMEVTVYVAAGGILQQTFAKLGIRILVDRKLLEKTLDATNWYGGCDLVWLNTAQCVHLMGGHSAPVPRPIVWWLGQEVLSLAESDGLQGDVSQLGFNMVTTLVASEEIGKSLKELNASWPISGVLPTLPPDFDERTAGEFKSLLENLVRLGISHRLPFEKGVK